MDLSYSRVRLQFKFVSLNGAYMNLTVVSNLETIEVTPADNVTVEINVKLPSDILLNFSGKGVEDTLVGDDGKILADKHVELVAAAIDRLPVSQHFIHNWPLSNNIRTAYFGFNESVKLEFQERNSFYFAIKHSG